MAKSSFVPSIGYLQQAHEYLAERGVNIANDRIKILPRVVSDCTSYSTLEKDPFGNEYHKIIVPEGWAFCVRQPFGSFPVDNVLVRVCNHPPKEVQVYERRRGKDGTINYKPVDGVPKFIMKADRAYLNDSTYWASSLSEIANQPLLIICEKFTAAILIATEAGIPAIGLSGCHNFGSGLELHGSLKDGVMSLAPRAKVPVIFDKDLLEKSGVKNAAKNIKCAIRKVRPDIEVKFMRPLGPSGLDDWWVEQGEDAVPLFIHELQEDGVEISSFYSTQELVVICGVETELFKKKDVVPHTMDSYSKLLLRLPEFSEIVCDNISGDYYKTRDYSQGCMSFDVLYPHIRMILETMVFHMNPKMSAEVLRDVIKNVLTPARTRSVLLDIIDDMAPNPDLSTERQEVELFLAAAGINGPMTHDELVEIFLRLARDQVHTWGDSDLFGLENFIGLSGPSGAGKTSLLPNMLSILAKAASKAGKTGKLTTTFSPGGKLEEFKLRTSDCAGVVIDELNSSRKAGADLLHEIYSRVTDDSFKNRDAYARGGSWHPMRALIVLTTVDDRYIDGDIDAGARRRLIPLTLGGAIVDADGDLRPDHEGISKHWFNVLACARLRMITGEDIPGKISAISSKYVEQAMDTSNFIKSLGVKWSADMDGLSRGLTLFGDEQRTKHGETRFVVAQLYRIITGREDVHGDTYGDFTKLIVRCGARKCKSSSTRVKGYPSPVQNAYEVVGGAVGWGAFIAAIQATF